MSEENIAFRLKFLIDNLGLTISQFADKCDIPRPTLSQLLSGRNKKISNLLIEQIHVAYPALSVTWLMFGEGIMWIDGTDSNSSANSPQKPLNCQEETNDSAPIEQEEKNRQNNPSENPDFNTITRGDSEYSKENALNHPNNASVNSKNEIVNHNFCDPEILAQLSKLKEKPRKVVQVTIYYDDSTFQTFYPNS